jgi:single-strand DNA-binding protein
MASVNKVIIVGNCGRDPEMRYLPSGIAACEISIATSSKRKDKNTGETIEETQWHRVKFFDKLAEIVGEYVRKGSSVYVEGRLKYGKYTDQAGVEKNTTDIIADSMQLLGGRQDNGQQAPAQRPAAQPQQRQAPQQRPAPQQRQQPPARQAPPRNDSGFDDYDDDIPF